MKLTCKTSAWFDWFIVIGFALVVGFVIGGWFNDSLTRLQK